MNDQENTTPVADEDVSEHDREADVVVEETEQPEVVVEGRDYRVEGNDISGYVGVSPEYMTYANETEKPMNTAQEQWDLGQLDHLEGNMNEEEKAVVEESETDTEEKDVETDETKSDETKSDETPSAPAPAHNPPSNVPGVITPTV